MIIIEVHIGGSKLPGLFHILKYFCQIWRFQKKVEMAEKDSFRFVEAQCSCTAINQLAYFV